MQMHIGSWRREDLPFLTPDNCEVTSECTPRYNCIAWAAGVTEEWWWPASKGYWPSGAPRVATVEAFIRAFETLGYAKCGDGLFDLEYEKIAIYARNVNGIPEPTHAARQLMNGRWTSKLGTAEDIEHEFVEDVNGPEYGEPVCFMRRPKKATRLS